jgi:hypothetical protein
MKTTSRNTDRQLQIWNTEAQRYEPHAAQVTDRDDARRIANGRGWRIADPDRPLVPQYKTPRSLSSGRTIMDVQNDYLQWAIAQGLKAITAWKGRALPSYFPGTVRRVTPEEHFAVHHMEIPVLVETRAARHSPATLSFYSPLEEIAA